jgi:predicted esterase
MNDFLLEQVSGPHSSARVLVRGNTVNPTTVLILLHGRGSTPEHITNILSGDTLSPHSLVVAPEAKDLVWFPGRFFDPLNQNELHIRSSLELVNQLVRRLEQRFSIHKSQIILAGFSQGASLVSEYLTRHPAQFKGVCIFSGALFGTDEEVATNQGSGLLLQTPVYMGCDVNDPHVPISRFQKTRDVITSLGATVTYKEYVDLRHAIHPEGIAYLHQLLRVVY